MDIITTVMVCLLVVAFQVSAAAAIAIRGESHPRRIAMAEASMAPANRQVTLHNLAKGARSGIHEPIQLAIRNQDDWNRFWKRHSSTEINPATPPRIDFDSEMVVAIFLGEKSTGGYAVEIVRAEQSDSSLYFYYRENSPSPNSMVTQAFTQPFHLVRVAKTGNREIIFRRES